MSDVLQRLRDRKLVQWALAYIAASFALIQVLDIVAQRFGWPEPTIRFIIIALGIGFFVTLVLAWYHGERGVQRLNGAELLILALLLTIGGGLMWRMARTPEAATPATSAPDMPAASIPAKSIAVLPLSNESGNKDEQYFSDGLSEDLITELSQFAGLKVISRNSSFQFRNSSDDAKTIGGKLGVAHLLEGSVRRAGEVVRVSAELVNAADGSTLWSQRYDRPYRDLFALQDDITHAVASELKAKLLESNTAADRGERPPSGNLDAWNAYSHGRFHSAMIDPDDAHKAIGYYQQAIALDPRYAGAYAGLALAWTTLGATFLGGDEQKQAYANARDAVDHALQLEANLAVAHTARGLLLQWADFDWTGAEAEFRRATELAPNDSLSRGFLGRLLGGLGRAHEAIADTRKAIGTDPREAGAWYWLGWYLAAIDQTEEAEDDMRKAVELMPGKPFLPAGLAIVQVRRGKTAQALVSARQEPPGTWRNIALAFALQGGDAKAGDDALSTLITESASGSAYQIAEVYGLRRDPDNMFKWLDRAWDTRDSGIGRMLTDPFILRYKDDPRFAAFCAKAGLPTTTDAKAMP